MAIKVPRSLNRLPHENASPVTGGAAELSEESLSKDQYSELLAVSALER